MRRKNATATTATSGLAALASLVLAAGACAPAPAPVRPLPEVMAVAQTTPVGTANDDAADDPAIWVHPEDPARSVILGTDKKAGLYVYDLAGAVLQFLPDGRLNNVDLRHAALSDGATLVAASDRTNRTIALYRLDTATRRLTPVGAPIPSSFVEPYGLCLYRSAADAGVYVFATNKRGDLRQWRLTDDAGTAELVREVRVGGQSEGCVADDVHGALYVGEEDVGIWRYGADPDAGADRVAIDTVGQGLVADVEGLAIYDAGGGRGYLVASSQGDNSYAVYDRTGDNTYRGSFRIADNPATGVDGTSETDGLDVTAAALPPPFDRGLLVVQDDANTGPDAPQNFKLVPWSGIEQVLGLDRH